MTLRYLALDVGAATTRIAVSGARSRLMTSVTPEGTIRDNICAALRMAPRPADEICIALPDIWFSGGVPEASWHEEVRHACEDKLGVGRIIWVGQLGAAAARHGRQRGLGRYLVCDLGYAGVRAGSFVVTDGTVRTETVLSRAGGGWREFDRAVRAAVDGLMPDDWPAQAAEQAGAASLAFRDAAASPDHRDDHAYRLTGPRERRLTAGQMMDCFAPARERLAAGISAALRAGRPDAVILTGGLGWFPLAALVVRDMTGMAAITTGPNETARGALLFARHEMTAETPAGLEAVSVPVNRIRDGFLQEESLELPWTEPFADLPEDMPPLDAEELVLKISGQYRTVRLPGLVAGPHRIGVRPGWSGPGVLVVRPASGDSAHVVSLDASMAM